MFALSSMAIQQVFYNSPRSIADDYVNARAKLLARLEFVHKPRRCTSLMKNGVENWQNPFSLSLLLINLTVVS